MTMQASGRRTCGSRVGHGRCSPDGMLRLVLRDVARAALLAALVTGSAACSSSIDRDGFESSAFCADDRSRLEALRVSLGADWVAIVGGEQVIEAGTCADGLCAAEREKAKTSNVAFLAAGQAGGFVLLVAKGQEVKVASEPKELAGALGPIDSPEKVHFVMWSHGYEVRCDRWVKRSGDQFEAIGEIMTENCDPIVEEEHRVAVRRDATISVVERVEVDREDGVCVGRRPAGLVSSPTGGWFARAAHLEAASIQAFRVLARELALHDAPRTLIAEAERSARDEIRHAAIMTRLARRFGEEATPTRVEARAPRSLFEIARENAIEGCVRETYGAVEAILLAEVETDPEVARAMHAIAIDEARHAELAWSIAAWARPQLSNDDVRALDDAMEEAVADLAREVPAEGPATLAIAMLRDRLWSLAPEARSG